MAETPKKVYEKAENFDVVYDYVPKEFPQIVGDVAEDFVNKVHEKKSDFQISELTAQMSGVSELNRKATEEHIEEQSLARLKDVEEKAYQEAYELGLIEGTEQAYQSAKADLEKSLDRLLQLVQEIESVKELMVKDSEAQVMNLITQIASKIAVQKVESEPATIMKLVEQIVNEVQSSEEITIRLNPGDHLFIENLKERSEHNYDFLKRTRLEPEDGITPGGCIVETPFGTVDGTLEQRVEKVWKTIQDKLPLVRTDQGTGTRIRKVERKDIDEQPEDGDENSSE